jgi:low temperature requirement protein LtrA
VKDECRIGRARRPSATLSPMLRLLAKPSLQVDWSSPDTHKAATWIELFSDLAIVAACIKLSAFFKGSGISETGLLRFVSLAALFIELWGGLMFYSTRFYDTKAQLFHQFVYFGVTASLVFMGTFVVDPVNLPHSATHARLLGASSDADVGFQWMVFPFSVAAACACATLGAANAALAVMLPRVRVMGAVYTVSYGLGVVLCAIAAHSGSEAAPWLFLATALTLKAGPTVIGYFPPSVRPPVHVEHVAERFGLLLMLVLGEGVISLVLPVIEADVPHLIFVGVSLTLLWLLREAYYSGQPFKAKHHAMRRKANAGRWFAHAHLPLNIAALSVGVALKTELTHVDEKLKPAESWLLGGAVCCFLLLTSTIRIAHRGLSREFGVGKYSLPALTDTPPSSVPSTPRHETANPEPPTDSTTHGAEHDGSGGAEELPQHHASKSLPSEGAEHDGSDDSDGAEELPQHHVSKPLPSEGAEHDGSDDSDGAEELPQHHVSKPLPSEEPSKEGHSRAVETAAATELAIHPSRQQWSDAVSSNPVAAAPYLPQVTASAAILRRRFLWIARLVMSMVPLVFPGVCNGNAILEVCLQCATVFLYVFTDVFDELGWQGINLGAPPPPQPPETAPGSKLPASTGWTVLRGSIPSDPHE